MSVEMWWVSGEIDDHVALCAVQPTDKDVRRTENARKPRVAHFLRLYHRLPACSTTAPQSPSIAWAATWEAPASERRWRHPRSHAPRGNASLDAPRRRRCHLHVISGDAERPPVCSHAERGNKETRRHPTAPQSPSIAWAATWEAPASERRWRRELRWRSSPAAEQSEFLPRRGLRKDAPDSAPPR